MAVQAHATHLGTSSPDGRAGGARDGSLANAGLSAEINSGWLTSEMLTLGLSTDGSQSPATGGPPPSPVSESGTAVKPDATLLRLMGCVDGQAQDGEQQQ